jgi:polyribonucleotide nucleotidyltransferase
MATTALSESEMKIIQKGLNELEKEANHAKEKMKEVIKEEQEMPLNVDTISKVHISETKYRVFLNSYKYLL